ncbi:ribonuclease H [Candidatus Beckwithbacteria bacterium CG10_big_fil_rev_8_21_14_0_10_34_10]|uniref:Ribonuclease H n=1 Tax=Candidatus Beckwithbacteria bacterium CG10_big_fil_rev_8_21_14_0_10_34_10 TaxID=1974495 RepID=A0A2H0W889_9BACT|nr:MAG: ribonuclease H [Candidatus Beckwithbacteria bacterium CG10_big_fil_rev_8_21_14_0_10_34_10]
MSERKSIKKIKNLIVFCDGGSRNNPGPAACGFIIKDERGRVYGKKGIYLGEATNNVAEYQGVIKSLNFLSDEFPKIKELNIPIQFFLDSMLVVNQLNGKFKVKDSKLRMLVLVVRSLEKGFKANIYYNYIPRRENKEADGLLNKALDKKLLKKNK